METVMHADPNTPEDPREAQAQNATFKALIATRALIAQGWTRGSFNREVDGVTCYCLTAAAMTAETAETGKSVLDWNGKGAFERIALKSCLIIPKLHDAIGDDNDFTDPVQSVTAWNDSPHRTKEHVLELIDRTIAAQVAA
jgi:hypothetical protein